jgi:outer membrane protein TolC
LNKISYLLIAIITISLYPFGGFAQQGGGLSSINQSPAAYGQRGLTTQSNPLGQPGETPANNPQPIIPNQQSIYQPIIGNITRPLTPTGAAAITDNVTTLSLAQAIHISIENNLSTLLAKEQEQAARGFRWEALSQLLPNIFGDVYQANQTLNLVALGLPAGQSVPSFVGPFNTFDARVSIVQNIFNWSAIRSFQAANIGISISQLQEHLAKEQVATFTALAYLEALRAQQHVSDLQANLNLARALLNLAQDQHDAGVATGIDVARAQTRVSEELTGLFQAQTEEAQARLQLDRIVGLRQDIEITLTDPLHFAPQALPEIGDAISMAQTNRYELRIAEKQVAQFDYQKRAIRAEQLPSIQFDGDYGLSGVRPYERDVPTRRYEVRLNVPIFNGGLTRGRVAVATSQQRQAELQLSSTRAQVEEDVRLALKTLLTTSQQVQTAMDTFKLAEKELQLAQDRFEEGVTDNIEVINAQTALENARDSVATALTDYNAARINLAAAEGQAESFRW